MDPGPVLKGESSNKKLSYIFFTAGCVLLVTAFAVGTTDNPPAIVAMLGGLFGVILGVIYRTGSSGMRKPGQQLLYWAPRVLCIVFVLFTAMFALDVFGEGRGLWGTALALIMHLIPTLFVLLVLAFSWRREWVGGIVYIALAVVYLVWAWGKPFAPSAIPLISGLLVLIGALFLLNWRYRSVLRGAV